jgi:hypothetical protein
MVAILPDGRKARGMRGATLAVVGAAWAAADAAEASAATVAEASGVAVAGARSAVPLPAGRVECDA